MIYIFVNVKKSIDGILEYKFLYVKIFVVK